MTTVSRELRQAIEQAGGQPVRIEDPEDHGAYVVLTEEAYQRLQQRGEARQTPRSEIPEDIRRSQDAFFRELPELLGDKSLLGKWIGYHGSERIGIASAMKPLIQECLRRGLADDQFDLFVIEPQSREIEEAEIVTPCV
jgi:hypothetical protein